MKHTTAQENFERTVEMAMKIIKKFNSDSISPSIQKLVDQFLKLANQNKTPDQIKNQKLDQLVDLAHKVGETPENKAMTAQRPIEPNKSGNNNSTQKIYHQTIGNGSLTKLENKPDRGPKTNTSQGVTI